METKIARCVNCNSELWGIAEHGRGWCGKCDEKRVESRRVGECQQRLADLSREMQRSGIPPRYAKQEWVLPLWANEYLVSKRGLCLTGGAGTGKTTTLCLLMRDHRAAELRESCLIFTDWKFVSVPTLVMELQDAWRKKDETEQTSLDILKRLAVVDRLVLDDLGAEKLTDYVRQSIYYLINEREQWERPTYITTNFTFAQLDEQFDSRISSRLAGMCDAKSLQGKDQRIK